MRKYVGRGGARLLDSGPMKRNNQTNDKTPRAPARGIRPENEFAAGAPVCGFGRERMSFLAVTERMAETPVYSVRTSSLPLAQLLRPSRALDGLLAYIETICDAEGDAPEPFERYLEYPVWPRDPATGRVVGKPSMSDAMLLGAHLRIAVEAKWTEPHFGPYETVAEWLREQPRDGASRKQAVLDAWLAEVRAAGALRRGVTAAAIAGVPYQLVHRAASACHRAGRARGVLPVLCYVVFRDPAAPPDETAVTRGFERAVLGRWTAWLDPEAIEVLCVSVPIVRTPAPRSSAAAARLFPAIGVGASLYRFDWRNITIGRAADRRSVAARSPDAVRLRETALAAAGDDRRRTARLARELDFLCENGFARKMTRLAGLATALRRAGVAPGPGRGMLSQSAVAFALGATTADPLRGRQPFRRFFSAWTRGVTFSFDVAEERREAAGAAVLGFARDAGLAVLQVPFVRKESDPEAPGGIRTVPNDLQPAWLFYALLDPAVAAAIPTFALPWAELPVSRLSATTLDLIGGLVVAIMSFPERTAPGGAG